MAPPHQGRFWHTRGMVLARVGNFLMNRIPEIVDVQVADDSMLLEENNNDDSLKSGAFIGAQGSPWQLR